MWLLTTFAQEDLSFKNFQLSFTRVSQAWGKYNDSLRYMFEKKGVLLVDGDIRRGALHAAFGVHGLDCPPQSVTRTSPASKPIARCSPGAVPARLEPIVPSRVPHPS